MHRNTYKWIDVSSLSLEQVHDALARHRREGWELSRVVEPGAGRLVLCLVNREEA